MDRRILAIVLLLAARSTSFSSAAQEKSKTQFALSTDVVDWACLGTINLDAGVSVHQHFSVELGAKFNPWEFTTGGKDLPLYNHQATAYAGMRYWPWYVFSGWWIGAQAQYTQYEETGIWRPALDTGAAVGGGLSVGYTLMLNEKLNLEFGLGVWAGRRYKYTLYCCPECMEVRGSGPSNFIALNDLSVAVMYVF